MTLIKLNRDERYYFARATVHEAVLEGTAVTWTTCPTRPKADWRWDECIAGQEREGASSEQARERETWPGLRTVALSLRRINEKKRWQRFTSRSTERVRPVPCCDDSGRPISLSCMCHKVEVAVCAQYRPEWNDE